MVTLTKQDKTEMRKDYFQKGKGKEFFKGANPAWDGTKMLAVLQAAEDHWVAGLASLKADMDAAAGVTMTTNQAKTLGRAWLQFKARRGG